MTTPADTVVAAATGTKKKKSPARNKAALPPAAEGTCSICVSPYSVLKRRKVVCHSCDISVCKDCMANWIVTLSEAVKCMNPACRKEWTRHWLVTQMGYNFMETQLLERRRQVLWEKLQAVLPIISLRISERNDAMDFGRIESEARIIQLKKELPALDTVYRNKHSEFSVVSNKLIKIATQQLNVCKTGSAEQLRLLEEAEQLSQSSPDKSRELIAAALDRHKCSRLLHSHEQQLKSFVQEREAIRQYDWDKWSRIIAGEVITRKKRQAYMVMKCPQQDCRGYVNNSWKCDLCKKKVCRHCREPVEVVISAPAAPAAPNADSKDDDDDSDDEDAAAAAPIPGHKCKPEAVETASLLAKVAKACPKCATQIQKIDGCDQMWCTQCQTTFSWRTGEIDESGRTHNPHFYEYQRAVGGGQAPRVPGDTGGNPCGTGLEGWNYVLNLARVQRFWPVKVTQYLQDIHRCLMDLHEDKLPKQRTPLAGFGRHHDLGMKYLLNVVTEADVRKELATRERKIDLHRSIIQIIEMSWEVGGLLFKQEVPAFIRHSSSRSSKLPVDDPDWARPEHDDIVISWLNQVVRFARYVNESIKEVLTDHKSTSKLFYLPQVDELADEISKLPMSLEHRKQWHEFSVPWPPLPARVASALSDTSTKQEEKSSAPAEQAVSGGQPPVVEPVRAPRTRLTAVEKALLDSRAG